MKPLHLAAAFAAFLTAGCFDEPPVEPVRETFPVPACDHAEPDETASVVWGPVTSYRNKVHIDAYVNVKQQGLENPKVWKRVSLDDRGCFEVRVEPGRWGFEAQRFGCNGGGRAFVVDPQRAHYVALGYACDEDS